MDHVPINECDDVTGVGGIRTKKKAKYGENVTVVPINECDDVTGVGGIRTKKKAKYGENVFYRFGNEVLF